MGGRWRPRPARLRAVLALCGLAVLTACTGPIGSGGADLTVTYVPDDGGPEVSERLVVEAVHCSDNGVHLLYGDTAPGQARVSAINDSSGGAGDDQAPDESSATMTLRLGDDLEFLSIAPFDADTEGFRLADHPGSVVFVGQDPWVLVARVATVSGTLTC